MAVVHVFVQVQDDAYPGLLLDWRQIDSGYAGSHWYGRVLCVTGELPDRLVRESWMPVERIRPVAP